MFELFGWSWAADAVSKLPKEVIYAGIGFLAIDRITERIAVVKIEKAKAEARKADSEVEALKLKLELQKKDNIETP